MGNVTSKAYKPEAEKKNNLLPKCVLCEKVPQLGINDGFLLSRQFICSDCEKIILSLDYNDKKYQELVEKLRLIMFKKNKKGSF
ncbi:Inhibitor of sigma-G Gin [Desulfonispora thiosulfatigenes DSM 11270]|uniref:Inhibitor of sigma-G Gin n=1 Tax=Desulfonispora thiosulfatigenes DSM 11270 TaxID=656914 RepID=A0A1W1V0X8_DESTI|nr:sigma factor G inhibitor Gin [Desulfonispora thiosulfatigenes]SMB86978.1 Inhibitor of sigma-G Gin [Desulfonispora thiosulfatigenes DSM 11270]